MKWIFNQNPVKSDIRFEHETVRVQVEAIETVFCARKEAAIGYSTYMY